MSENPETIVALLKKEVEDLRQENRDLHVLIHGIDNQSGLLLRFRNLESKVDTELKQTKWIYVLITVIVMPVVGAVVSKLWPEGFK